MPDLDVSVLDQARLDDGGCVDQNVQPVERRKDIVDDARGDQRIRDVTGQRERPAAARFDPLGQRMDALSAAPIHNDGGASFRQLVRGRFADP